MIRNRRERRAAEQRSSRLLTSDDSKGAPQQSETEQNANSRTTYVVVIALILDLLGFTMILPLFPSIMEYYRQNDGADGLYMWCLGKLRFLQEFFGARDESSSVLFGGFLGSMFSMLQFTVSPIVGALSDVYGRKPLMLICLVGMASSYLMWGLSYNFLTFVIARFIGGISKGNVSLSLAVIADILPHQKRGWGMALVGMAFSVGFIVGPMVGAAFAHWTYMKAIGNWYTIPAACAFSLAVINILFVMTMMEETLPRERRASSVAKSMSEAMAYINIHDLFNFKSVANLTGEDLNDLKKLGLIYFLYIFVYSGLEFTVTFLTHSIFNFTSMDQGKMFFIVGLMMAVVQGGYVRRIPAEKIPNTALLGFALIIPGYLLVGASPLLHTVYLLFLGLMLYALSTALVIPAMNTLVSEFGSHEQKGTVMGIFRALGALARALGPVVFCFIFWSIGPVATYTLGAAFLFAPYWIMMSLVMSWKSNVGGEHQK